MAKTSNPQLTCLSEQRLQDLRLLQGRLRLQLQLRLVLCKTTPPFLDTSLSLVCEVVLIATNSTKRLTMLLPLLRLRP